MKYGDRNLVVEKHNGCGRRGLKGKVCNLHILKKRAFSMYRNIVQKGKKRPTIVRFPAKEFTGNDKEQKKECRICNSSRPDVKEGFNLGKVVCYKKRKNVARGTQRTNDIRIDALAGGGGQSRKKSRSQRRPRRESCWGEKMCKKSQKGKRERPKTTTCRKNVAVAGSGRTYSELRWVWWGEEERSIWVGGKKKKNQAN